MQLHHNQTVLIKLQMHNVMWSYLSLSYQRIDLLMQLLECAVIVNHTARPSNLNRHSHLQATHNSSTQMQLSSQTTTAMDLLTFSAIGI